MRRAVLLLVVSSVLGAIAATAATASPPPGATARCRDGTYSYSKHRSGTCSQHGGVAQWLSGSGSSGGSSSSGSSGSCGVERWTVKTLQDRPHLLANRKTTVHHLVTRPRPSSLPPTRLPFERHVFTVVAQVTFVREEADSDYHFILSESGAHMIAEAPASYCDRRATRHYRHEMAQARRAAKTCARARVTGVAFFDSDHGQRGVAPNAIELHPMLGFRCLSG
jgi:hypothetical protein